MHVQAGSADGLKAPHPAPGSVRGPELDTAALVGLIRQWALELGFSQIGITQPDLSDCEPGLLAWLAAGMHGGMDYMARHGLKRARPAELVPGTLSVISVRMDYRPRHSADDWVALEWARLADPAQAVVSTYARGRDYHKVLRTRLAQLARRIDAHVQQQVQQQVQGRAQDGARPAPVQRVFTDSAPVLEAELATRSGIGWRGQHTLVLSRDAGSMFFLGEIFIGLALPPTAPVQAHCGSCRACMDECPTAAIVAPQRLDARRCISYLTIEHDGPIDPALRPLMGNRIYGCDDCQLACPWNKFAQRSPLPDFDERAGLSGQQIAQLLLWSEAQFLQHTEGSAIRRIGHVRWQRNLAVAAGNALAGRVGGVASAGRPARRALAPHEVQALVEALQRVAQSAGALVREHAQWALQQPLSAARPAQTAG